MTNQEIQRELDRIWSGWIVKDHLGQGSFGAVYRIERLEYGCHYESALKVISIPSNSSEIKSLMNDGMDEESIRVYLSSVVEDIVSEISTMYHMKGISNIVSYEDHCVTEKQDGIGWNIYIRMELLTPLFDYVNEHKMTNQDVIRLGIDMCNALEICQKFNIVHRDIKPENIFVTQFGDYKLGDFGIARQMEMAGSNLSKKGTYVYMAPELYKGEECNSTVDIYSLGIVLYRFLNGNRTPFLPPYPQQLSVADKKRANVMRMRGSEIPKPLNGGESLAQIVLKACAYNPKDRYENPTMMKEALFSVLSEGEETILIDSNENPPVHKNDVMQKDSSDQSFYYLFGTESTDYIRQGKEFTPQEDPEENQDMNPEEAVIEKKPFRKNVWIFVTLLLLIMGIFFTGYRFYQKSLERLVPDLTHLTLEEAKIEAAGEDDSLIVMEMGSEYSDTVAKGSIVSQDVKEGSILKKGDVIGVTISKGKLIKIMNLIGNKENVAEEIVRKAGLNWEVKSREYSDELSKGVVISQTPQEGQVLEEDEVVTVVVSMGIEQVKVPDVSGMTLEEAKESIKNEKLSFDSYSEEYSNLFAEDKVISQSIKAGKKVDKNTKVKLIISKGPEPEPEPTTQAKKTTKKSKKKKKSSDGGDDGFYYIN